MSKIVSIDINYSSNSSPHTASVTTVAGPPVQDIKKASTIGNVQGEAEEELCLSFAKLNGKVLFFGQDSIKINSLLRNYVVDEISETQDSKVTKLNYKLIDSLSAKFLDSVIVLVRGISSPPSLGASSPRQGNYFYDGRIFDGSELPGTAKSEGPRTNETVTEPHWDDQNKILFIGRTRSVFSPNNFPEKEEYIYEQGNFNKLASFGNSADNPILGGGEGATFIETVLKPQRSSVSLRYGYTIREFINTVGSNLNIEFTGLDKFDKTPANVLHKLDTFVNFTGTLRSCISSIAALLGLYWHADPSSASKKIHFVSKKSVASLNKKLEDTNDGSEDIILSKTKTEKGFGPNLVLSFIGSSDPPEPVSIRRVFTSEGRDLGKTNFKRVPTGNLLGGQGKINFNAVRSFFDFFMLGQKNSERDFEKLFFAVATTTKFGQNHFGSIYPASNFNVQESQTWKDMLTAVQNSIRNLRIKNYTINSKAYTLTEDDDFGKGPIKPDEFYSFCRNYYNILGRIYISRSFVNDADQSRVLTSSSMSLHGPFHKSTPLIDVNVGLINEFLELEELGGFKNLKSLTINKLREEAGWPENSGNNSGYYYIGEKNTNPSLKEIGGSATISDKVVAQIGILDSRQLPHKNKGILLLSSFDVDDKNSGITALVDSSRDHFKKFFDNKKGEKNLTALVDVAVSNKEDDESPGGGGLSDEPEGIPELNFKNTIYRVKGNRVKNPRRSQLIQFNGSIQDVNALIRNVADITEQSPDQISISKSYYGLVIPDIDITLDSVSINIGQDGVTTSITRSAKQLLPVDQSIIIDQNKQTFSPATFNRFSAAQKNALKI